MIASRLHNFIYIKTMKTGSTSIELALGPYCGPNDTLMPISARFDKLRADNGVEPRNFADPSVERRYLEALGNRNPRHLKMVLREIEASRYWAHATADIIMANVGDLWNTAFRFTSERHPYEKALSLAHFSFRGQSADFPAHLERTVFKDPRYLGHPFYSIEGKIIAHDFVLHEKLEADFHRVTRKLGLPETELPYARRRARDRTPAHEVLSSVQKDFIFEQCRPEFDLFGWKR